MGGRERDSHKAEKERDAGRDREGRDKDRSSER